MPEGSGFVTAFQASPFAGTESGRQRFHVELTSNVVSWKKLLKSAPPPPAAEAPPGANPALEARLAPETVLLCKEPRGGPNRFSNVIEKIERLYQGQGQESDDEIVDNHLDNVPDDDQYNTDDSFIDDKELDEYFSVDYAKTKHSGFFINKGKLENIEPNPPCLPVPKKRKRKEVKTSGSEMHAQDSSKKSKAVGRVEQESVDRPSSDGIGECLVNKQSETQVRQAAGNDAFSFDYNKFFSRDGSSCREANYISKNVSLKGLTKNSSRTKENERNEVALKKSAVGSPSRPKFVKAYSGADACKVSSSANSTLGNSSVDPQKRSTAKVSLLERAIQDLKAGVAQLRPIPDVLEPNATGKVRRLPREIKAKIAKVARLAARQGKVPDELIDRLMSILGHLMQLKTLKRNLKEMVEMGLVAKHEKEHRLSHMKRDLTEIVRSRVQSIQAKAEEGFSNDVQGVGEKNYKWDQATEDRICELYDQYLEGTDENRGTQSRKLYMELADLWPEGWMDKDGIKNAVYRAKERRKALQKQSLNESRKKFSERIDLNERPEAPLALAPNINGTISNRDLPSSAVQAGKPAVIRKQMQRGYLDKHDDFKDKKRVEESIDTDPSTLAFLKFKKQTKPVGTGELVFDASYQGLRSVESVFLDRPS
ncbi:ubinuclein-1 [Selaginella moellendorffii]|uniref:ubinuclein-1 n=1 Tax=Selaginella moellendorffii TaxID=88036 RepID=UPI000D1C2D11|nr:ubinuclein-1 [Selaginella moellendorffii]|eukprot:XP_024542185.1 ubinuclein-1 [Selaginella moellendorffii]